MVVLCFGTSVWFIYANLFSHSSFIYIVICTEARWLSGEESACKAGDAGSIPRLGRPLEKEMATHSSVHCLGNPTDRGAGRLQSLGLRRVGHDLVIKQQIY